MTVIFEDDGLKVMQDINGAIVFEFLVSPHGTVGVRKHLPVAKAMEMTAVVNTACFRFQKTARTLVAEQPSK